MRNWPTMEQALRQRFLSIDYHQSLYTQFLSCMLGNQSIDEYVAEFMRLAAHNDVEENEDQMIARFVDGLNYEVKSCIEFDTFLYF